MESGEEIPGPTAKFDVFWLAIAAGSQDDVGEHLARAGYSSVIDAIRDLHEDVLGTAQDLRERNEIEPAVEMERLAAEMASYLNPN